VPAPRHATGAHVSPDLLHILDRLTPAFVVSDLGELLVQNPSVAVSGDLGAGPARDVLGARRETTARPSPAHRLAMGPLIRTAAGRMAGRMAGGLGRWWAVARVVARVG
jgi:hypothetical protein